MKKVIRSALVPYTPSQMFELVNDLEKYPHFLPWCKQTEVLFAKEEELRATIHIAKSGFEQSFTTHNHLKKDEKIMMQLVDGPFSHLQGIWLFENCNDQGCNISFDVEFEFSNKLLAFALNRYFEEIVTTIVAAFSERAHQVYANTGDE